jgi:hypothetical protein
VIFDQAPAARRRRPTGARRTFDGVAGLRRTAGVGASWHRIQNSPTAIAPPTSSRNRSGDARRGLNGRNGIMSISYTKSRFVTSGIGSPQREAFAGATGGHSKSNWRPPGAGPEGASNGRGFVQTIGHGEDEEERGGGGARAADGGRLVVIGDQ